MKWYALFLAVTVSSCGSSHHNSDDLRKDITHRDDLSDFGRIVDEKANVYCGEENCPNSVVAVYNAAGKSSSLLGYSYDIQLCSGTLIAKDLVATNFHCIEKEWGKAEDNCRENTYIKTQSGATFGCEEIIYDNMLAYLNEDDDFIRRDIALIRLKTDVLDDLGIKYSKVVSEKLVDGKSYEAFVVNFGDSLEAGAEIKQRACQVRSDNNVFPLGKEVDSYKFMAGCDVISGNSGSALFNEKQEIVALLFAKIKFADINQLWQKYFTEQDYSLSHRAFDNLFGGIAVSFSCMENSDVTQLAFGDDFASCPASIGSFSINSNIESSAENIELALTEHLLAAKDYTAEHQKYFDFTIEKQDEDRLLVPHCFRYKEFAKDYAQKLADKTQILSEMFESIKIYDIVTTDFIIDDQTYRFRATEQTLAVEREDIHYYLLSSELDVRIGNGNNGIVTDCLYTD